MPGLEWVVSSVVRFSGNGPVFMSRLASSTQAANAQFMRQQGLISKADAQLGAYQRRMEGIRAQQLKFTQQASGGIAVIGLGVLAYGATEAAKLEKAMTGVQIATGATAKEYTNLRAQVLAVSGYTAQSAVTIANEMAAAAQVAFHDPKQLQKLFPMMAKYADVRAMSPAHDDPVNSIERMSQMAHFFGAYTPEKMAPLLDQTAKLQFTTKADLNQLVTQGKYFIPIATQMGVSMDTIFQYLAIMGQQGMLSGKGGTSMKNIITGATSVTPTAHLSQAKFDALNDLHLRDKTGNFKFLKKDKDGDWGIDLVTMTNQLRSMEAVFKKQDPKSARGRMTADLGAIFGQSALPFLTSLINKMTAEQMARNKEASKKIPGVEGQWKLYSRDLFYQFNAFKTNLENLATVISSPSLKALTSFFENMANALGSAVAFLSAHPAAAATIFSIVSGLTALAGITFTATSIAMWMNAAKALQLLAGVGATTTATAAAAAAAAAGGGGTVAAVAAGMRASAAASAAGAAVSLGARFASLGLKIIPVVGQLALLYTALTTLIGGIAWFNESVLHYKKAARYGGPDYQTPSTHNERAARAAAFRPAVQPAHTGRIGAVKQQTTDHKAAVAAFRPAVSAPHTGRVEVSKPAEHKPAAATSKPADQATHTSRVHVEHLQVSLPGVKTWQEVQAFIEGLKDTRSAQASHPSQGATVAFQAPVLNLGLGVR